MERTRDGRLNGTQLSGRLGQWIVLGAALSLLSSAGAALAYLTDSNVYAPPSYLGWLPPEVGGVQTDPVFGTPVKRISNAPLTPDGTWPGQFLTFIMTEYPTVSPFNNDNSRLLVMHQSYFALYDGSGHYIQDLLEVQSYSEPRWSRHNSNLLYYINGNQLKQYDVATGVGSVVRTFSEYTTISGRNKSDICFDGDHFVLVGDQRHIFVYEISTDTKGPALDTTGLGDFESVHITPDDNVLVAWYARGSGRYQGVELYDRGMNFLRQVVPFLGHMDVTRDVDGSEVLLWINAAHPTPAPVDCQNALVKVRLADGQQTCLAMFDWSLAHHVSGTDGNGWAFVSTYSPVDLSPLIYWPAYANEILQVRLDGSREVRRLAHHRSRPFNAYTFQPRVAASRDGSRIVYSSNYGLQALLGYPAEYSDVYFIRVPNQSPVANAGADQTRECTSPTGTLVTVDGSASFDPDGNPLTFTWTGPFPEGGGRVTSIGPTVKLPLGTSAVNLVVNDGQVDSTPDTVLITVTVRVAGLEPPLAALVPAGDPILILDTVFNQGRTLPLKLQLFCGLTALTATDVAPPQIVALLREGTAVDLPSSTLFQFSDGRWVYHLGTQSLSVGTYIITVQMPDGRRFNSGFVLR